jgi:putative peptidoglycan lipid II flippase
MTKAAFLGTTALSDAFSVAFMIPNLFRRLFAEGSIAVAFIPTFKEYLLENETGQGSKENIKEFLSCILTFLSFFVTLTVMLGIILCPLVIRFFGMEEFNETVFLTRIMFPFLAFISIAAFFQGILNSLKIFAPSGFAPILLNLIVIICAYVLSPYTQNPARAMAIGVLIGGFMEAAIQLPFILRHKSRMRFFFTGLKKAINHPGTRKILRLIAPTIIGMAAYQLNDLVSTALAGNAGEGIVSSLQYSLRLQELVLGIFAVSIGTVLLPELAEHAKSRQWELFTQRLVSAMNIIALITIPITFFFLAQGQNLIGLIFLTRTFDEESLRLTLAAFIFHMPGLYFIALNRIIAPAFYAQSDTKSPTIAGIISFAVNISLALLLVSHFKGSGIAFALSFASAVNTGALLFFLRKKPGIILGAALKDTLAYTIKLLVFSGLALIPVLLLSPQLTEIFIGRGRIISMGVPLLINGLAFAATGIVLLAATKDRHLLGIVQMIKKQKS